MQRSNGNKTNFSKAPARRRNRNRRANVAVTVPRALAYSLPSDQFRIALKYSGTVNASVTSFGTDVFGIAGPGVRIPKYWSQYFGVYKYAYIESVSLQFQITETNNRPLRVVVAESNSVDITPTSYLELAETPRAIQKQVIAGGNHSVVNLRVQTKAQAIMGHKLEDDIEYWNTVSAGPSAFVLPVVVLGYEPIVAASVCAMTYQVMITYHLKYFTLNHL